MNEHFRPLGGIVKSPRQGWLWRSLLRLSVAFGLSLFIHASSAQYGDIFSAPEPNIPNRSGLKILVNALPSGPVGNRPIYIRLERSNGAPFTQDATFTIEIELEWLRYGPGGNDTSTSTHEFSVSEGATWGEAILPHPVCGNEEQSELRVRVRENGTLLDDLDVQGYASSTIRSAYWSFLFIDPTAPPLHAAGAVNANVGNNSGVPRTLQDLGVSQFVCTVGTASVRLPLESLQEDWTAYSGFDGMYVPSQVLDDLARNQPEKLRAILRWWSTGRLLVTDSGIPRAQVQRLLDNQLLSPSESSWRGLKWVGVDELDEIPVDEEIWRTSVNGSPFQGLTDPNYKADTETRIGCYGLSTLVYLDKATLDDRIMQRVYRVIEARYPNGSHEIRVGYEINNADSEFGDWLVPGVGLPPVGTFRILITLFVIVIGPVNYFLLRRLRRLYLLLVTVPAGALIICLSLFAYSIFADGIGTKARIMSVTLIDSDSREAVTWSRQTYFTPILPREGLRFPQDSEVLPIVADNASGRNYDYQSRDGWFSLRRGNTGSRATSQYFVSRCFSSDASVSISAGDDPGKLNISNQLGADALVIVVTDQAGKHFVVEGLEAGSASEVSSVDEGEAITAAAGLLRSNTPENPIGYRSPSEDWSYRNGNRPSGFQRAGVMGRIIREVMDGNHLAPGTYCALVERSPGVVYMTNNTSERSSLHLVLGEYRDETGR